ncbi:glutamate-ammonia ligase [Zea mays]|uniref:Glutamate-ammonia ligase n=1 Tax=Zea mays TaxID=4577 RepID=A0A1D6KU73_MAIZE|nr:glutamate-ammonia ligase [Zea mays]ONM06134.1 glutamate-ammonia ligase [Zea mays]
MAHSSCSQTNTGSMAMVKHTWLHLPSLAQRPNLVWLSPSSRAALVQPTKQAFIWYLIFFFCLDTSRPDLDDFGSGSHVHLSLWENDQNVFMGSSKDNFHGMSKTGEQFLAGVYHHLPSILAFTAPHPNSYDRIQPDTWSGAYLCWGKENREAPLRTACPPGVPLDLVSNFEIKSFDGCANPHLGLAAIVAAGIDGLRRHLKLPEPIESNPSDHSSKLKRLPQNLQESVESLSADKVLHELIGDKLVTTAIAIRKAEINHFAKNPGALKDLIDRY